MPPPRPEDDERYWRYGIYLNPDDPRLMVPDPKVPGRFGINGANPKAKLLLLIPIGITAWGLFLMFWSRSP